MRQVAPRPTPQPGATYAATSGGVRAALSERLPALHACHDAHRASGAELVGRFSLALRLDPIGDQASALTVTVENDGDELDGLEQCVQAAFDDAPFGAVSIPTTVLLPVPLPSRR